MAVIHRTTLKPSKLELLTSWLPSRPWYAGGAGAPDLAKAGGFRLDDPDGEVGIEFLIAADPTAAYLVPLTYRGAPLTGAEHALVGVMEHGVLGRRWAYDGAHDPVMVAQLLALIEGRVEAQDQDTSDVPDRDVTRSCLPGADLAGFTAATDTPEGTDLSGRSGATLHLHRVLRPAPDGVPVLPPGTAGHVSGPWRGPDGTRSRGLFATVRTVA
ncbi:hypothetical protein EDD29_2978 [Actinocorallia herbida]|uniref:Maltokinase N-terminal cap domain-containing protein n=1 Tax=Actinocorallia herbida TaxID=58109 RepID=A0A3N1CW01_9ACTN|nr:1,4-alpha-glucan branching protein [Actinocorallia herbida]ROO85434.1 hypothetical protein EDD29_2978 [Actinocorallia herbida]